MRGPIVCASLIACTALFPPQIAAGEEPTGRIVRASQSPNTVGWKTRAHDNPSIPQRPSVKAPSIEAPGQPPANVRPGRPRSDEVTRNSGNPVHVGPLLLGGHNVYSGGCDTIQAGTDEAAFLRPVWDRGFWPMPPGGLTRYLIPARTFINPEETLWDATFRLDALSWEPLSGVADDEPAMRF